MTVLPHTQEIMRESTYHPQKQPPTDMNFPGGSICSSNSQTDRKFPGQQEGLSKRHVFSRRSVRRTP